MIMEDFLEIESSSDSGDPIDKSLGGVKVLSGKTGNDEILKMFGYP